MLRLRHLRLRAITSLYRFGAELPFLPGLNVVHAGNTSGKSTCLQAIVYALGLERSLGPQLQVPLPYAMRERIHRRRDDPYEPVLESYIELEIENLSGDILTIRRDITGGKDTKLIQTWNSARLSQPGGDIGHQRDFFVHDPGAAQREEGFHHYLAKFIGWDLPLVPRFDGVEVPLHLEAIFPMLFVEQKRGWATIQGPFPTFFRIQDVARRVLEFLLNLEAGRNRRERAEIRRLLTANQQKWLELRATLADQAGPLVRLRGLPASPTAEFAHAPDVEIELLEDDEWRPLEAGLVDLATRLKDLEAREAPTAEEAAPEIEKRLEDAREQIDAQTANLETLRTEYHAELQDHRAIESRLQGLEADLRKNQDALKLKELGSELGQIAGDGICPTCHQSVTSEPLPVIAQKSMALDENITFIRSQIELYRLALHTSDERSKDLYSRYYATQQAVRDLNLEIRGLRQSLVQPSLSSSRAVVEAIVRIQARLDHLQATQEKVDTLIDQMRALAQEWADLQDRLRRLSTDDLTSADLSKISGFETSVQEHLGRYGFRSFRPDEIELSRDNFRPLRRTTEDGEIVEKEINFEVSASDAIRLKWAYYLALIELSRRWDTNHCGLVVFDEPGQQEIEAPSLQAFVGWAARNISSGQVVLASSEELSNIEDAIAGTNANLITFEGFILQPV